MSYFYLLLSYLTGLIARTTRPRWFVRLLLRSFAHLYHLNSAELSQPLSSYPSLLSLFIREPAPRSRPVDPNPYVIVSPVDAYVSSSGTASHAHLFLVKGHRTNLRNLLGSVPPAFQDATYLTLYLSPRDIHRIYAPCDLHVIRAWAIPGTLFSVSPRACARRPNVLSRNRRVVSELAAPWGTFLMVKIGACNVGKIVLNYPTDVPLSPPPFFRKGDELARFELGSTVILIFPPASVVLLPHLREGSHILIGQPIARILPPSSR